MLVNYKEILPYNANYTYCFWWNAFIKDVLQLTFVFDVALQIFSEVNISQDIIAFHVGQFLT
jgi:hypothetical protein